MPFVILEQPFELIKAFSYNSFLLYGVHDGNDDVLVRGRNLTNPGMRELAHDEFEIARRSFIDSRHFGLALLTGKTLEDVQHYHARHPSIEWFATRPAAPMDAELQCEWTAYHFKGSSFPAPTQVIAVRRDMAYPGVEERIKEAYSRPIFISKRNFNRK